MLFLWSAFVVYHGALLSLSIYALRFGGSEERAATVALVLCSLASSVVSFTGARWGYGPELGVMTVDVLFLIVTLVIVYVSRAFWPLWAAAAQLAGTISHGVRWVEPNLAREVYATVQPFWAFPIMLAIYLGARSQRALSQRKSAAAR